uniref:Uncharacterized protein n=1 Tax=Scophthalmus maximus TaxID=52904 RepID=A0A8D2ZE55_SCOMX
MATAFIPPEPNSGPWDFCSAAPRLWNSVAELHRQSKPSKKASKLFFNKNLITNLILSSCSYACFILGSCFYSVALCDILQNQKCVINKWFHTTSNLQLWRPTCSWEQWGNKLFLASPQLYHRFTV